MANAAKNGALVCVALAIALLLGEAALRLAGFSYPNFWLPDPLTGTRLRPGMVFAVEPMVNLGGPDVEILEDEWTAVTADGSPSAHFEHTILITDDEPEVLTRVPGSH